MMMAHLINAYPVIIAVTYALILRNALLVQIQLSGNLTYQQKNVHAFEVTMILKHQ